MKNEHVLSIPIPMPIPLGVLLGGAVNVSPMPEVRQVMFNPPATIVHWSDGTKTVARCNEQDTFSEEVGLAMACAKKLLHPYESFQECLDNAIRLNEKKRPNKAPAVKKPKPVQVRVEQEDSVPPNRVKQDDSTPPNRVGLDELLRMFANGAPSGTIEATIVLN